MPPPPRSANPVAPEETRALRSAAEQRKARERALEPATVRSWKDERGPVLWQAVANSDRVATIGLGDPSSRQTSRGGTGVLSQGSLAAGLHRLSKLGVEILAQDSLLPHLRVRLADEHQLNVVLRDPAVAWVEPAGMVLRKNSGDGCGAADPWTGTNTSPPLGRPLDLVPDSYRKMGVFGAWTVTDGGGVRVAMIDTGVDDEQPQLSTYFLAAPFSNGRELRRLTAVGSVLAGTIYEGGTDVCGHGTKMAAVVAAPADGRSTVGIAPRASLLAIGAAHNVVLNSDDSWNVKYAIREAVTLGSDIVSLGVGWLIEYPSIGDEIRHAYATKPRTVFIAPAGTSFNWELHARNFIVHPAAMPEVVAVNTVNDDGLTLPPSVHYGPELDFACYRVPAVAQGSSMAPVELGGSSVGTAACTGVFALVAAAFPTATRDTLIARVRRSTGRASHSLQVGWGVPNAACAVGLICEVYISGQSFGDLYITSSGMYTFTGGVRGGSGNVSYAWDGGATGTSFSRFIDASSCQSWYMWVTATDNVRGTSMMGSIRIVARDSSCAPEDPGGGCGQCFLREDSSTTPRVPRRRLTQSAGL